MTIAECLLAAQKKAQAVAKDSTNAFHRYKYASAEALIEEARQALIEAGLIVSQQRWMFVAGSDNLDPPGRDESGGARCVGHMKITYRIRCEAETEDNDTEVAVIVEKGRPLDKAQKAALTLDLGYFLRGLLLLPREDPDLAVDQRDDRPKPEYRPVERPQPKPEQRRAPPPLPVPGTSYPAADEEPKTIVDPPKQATLLEIRAAMKALEFKGPDIKRKLAAVFGPDAKDPDFVKTEAQACRLRDSVVADVQGQLGLSARMNAILAEEKANAALQAGTNSAR